MTKVKLHRAKKLSADKSKIKHHYFADLNVSISTSIKDKKFHIRFVYFNTLTKMLEVIEEQGSQFTETLEQATNKYKKYILSITKGVK